MLEITQWLAGRDFARGSAEAAQMANFVYLVSAPGSGEGLLVDAAWDIDGLLALARQARVKVVGAVATHRHFDHVGGEAYGMRVEGLARLVERTGVPVYAHASDAAAIAQATGLPPAAVRPVEDGAAIPLGAAEVKVLHVPGHSPGAICLLAGGALLTGDTLFVGECGRVDLAGSDPDRMFASLGRLAALPDETVVYPGHDYGPTPRSTIAHERRTNPALQPKTLEQWRAWLRE